jgi:cytochrome c oxidase subunit II
MFSPVSPQAHAITTLMLTVFAICAAIFVLVAWLVAYGAIRYRSRGDAADPVQSFGNTRVEALWTAGPLLLLVVIFALTVTAGRAADPSTPNTEPDIRLIGHQWWWEVQYPRAGIVSANEIHIPTNTRVLLELRSADVIHDFWVPELGRKMDMVPGHPTRLWIEADAAGTYGGACAEYCGAEHAWMRLRVVAEPAVDFASWMSREQTPAKRAGRGAAAEGERLFDAMTCVNCHAIAGTGHDARVGPDLTHIAARARLAGELIENTPENLARWIAHPDALKPSSHMPNLHLSSNQVTALVAYMETLR